MSFVDDLKYEYAWCDRSMITWLMWNYDNIYVMVVLFMNPWVLLLDYILIMNYGLTP